MTHCGKAGGCHDLLVADDRIVEWFFFRVELFHQRRRPFRSGFHCCQCDFVFEDSWFCPVHRTFEHGHCHLACMPGNLYLIFILDHAHPVDIRTDIGDFIPAGPAGDKIPYYPRHLWIVDADIPAVMLFEKISERSPPLIIETVGPCYDFIDRCLLQRHLLLHQRRDKSGFSIPCHEEQFRAPPFYAKRPVISRQIMNVCRVGDDDERVLPLFHYPAEFYPPLAEIHHTDPSFIPYAFNSAPVYLISSCSRPFTESISTVLPLTSAWKNAL